jgi:DegV family protein with EDD domain
MQIVTDSGADITGEEARALGVTLAQLSIHFPEGETDPSRITADEFYDRMRAMHPAIPTTAQPSGGMFAGIYRSLAAGPAGGAGGPGDPGDPDILSIHISSGLSGTLNAARLGAEEVGPAANVVLWDTLTLSGGERFQVLAAALACRAGWPPRAIMQRLAEIRARQDVVFTLETLEYLARGGRIGRVAGLAGMLLNVKPVIHVDHQDGKYDTLAKSRTTPRALVAIGDYLHAKHGDEPLWVSVQHGRWPDQAEALTVLLKQRLNIAKLETVRISPVLGVHTGPGIAGASVVPMTLMSDLV